MAQENVKKQEDLKLRIFKRKVQFFARMITVAKSMELLKILFNTLCPTKQEKQEFIEMFKMMYPEDKLVVKYLCDWANQAYETEKEADSQKVEWVSEQLASQNLKSDEKNPTTPAYEEKQKNVGLFRWLKKLFAPKKGTVEKVSKEAVFKEYSAMGATKQSQENKGQFSQEKYEKYNQRVRAKAEQKMKQPAFSKGASVMTR